ncbi:Chromatin SPT2 [Penicillium canariense]|uniref:Chromatin SPT2 n=1 Tax=Penicillium canariense TaxID=189055 RepID=A0A9W9LUQ4_9EURO|nr:Chromatin SPT2 [Penicillium canariense]KAJ5176117.1 Chromatin SPT2 [Penicillium canariense]
MSFLDSVLSSLQTGKPTQAPLSQPPAPPASSSAIKKDDRRLGPAPRAPQPSGNVSGGIKRKAEDHLPRPSRPDGQVASKPPASRPTAPSGTPKALSKTASPKPVSRNGTTPTTKTPPAKAVSAKPAMTKLAAVKPAASKPAAVKPAAVPSKPPPKGSFADLMQQAKAMQDKAPTQLGMLRHQTVPKEKLSKVERKRRLMEAKAQDKAARSGKRPVPGPAPADKSAVKRRSPEALSYKGTAKPSQTPEPPVYRGTAGQQSHRGTNDRRPHGKRRMDEYLGTDEEDEGEYRNLGDYDDFYSDASSDMEAGFDDMRHEEDVALKSARKEDEEELRREMAAKKEKMERQRKLAALASRSKR